MAASAWPTKTVSVASLHLDAKNPRLGRETSSRAPREIIQYLFEHDKAMDVAKSIASRGYFPNEPLLAIKEGGRYVVVEGNRRLAALKVLREPGLLEGARQREAGRLARQLRDPVATAKVPVTIAPSRRATDQQIAGRHIGKPVLSWQAENRASFILDKLSEGYSNDELRDELGFSLTDIQQARLTRAIPDMARSLDLPDEVKAKLDNPRARLFTLLKRIFDSSVGRHYLNIEPDPDHGLRGTTTKKQFIRGFTKLVTDVALRKESSRSLNNNENIRDYFESWESAERPSKKRGTFVPSDLIKGKSVASRGHKPKAPSPKRSKKASATVLPKDFKLRFGNDRLIDIHRELIRLKREEYPNAGAVLLRVFFELAVLHYLDRVGKLAGIVERIMEKGGSRLPFGIPKMKQLVPEIVRISKAKLPASKALLVEKAITYNSAAPFTLSDLHSFVHSTDLPGDRDIQQFWNRTEPLFRLMLEQDIKGGEA